MKNKDKAAVAFSGGLDTSFCTAYLVEQGYDVATVTVDTGGFSGAELESFSSLSADLGATAHYNIDARAEFYTRFVTYLIKGNVLRGETYPLCAGLERYIQGEKAAEAAREFGAAALCHGSTGAGNDQVRFDAAVRCSSPGIKVLAPVRELEISREEEISFLFKKGHKVPGERKRYSINQSILGNTIGGAETHESWSSLPDEAYILTCSPENAPDNAAEITLSFENGLPSALNGEDLPGEALLKRLNGLGGRHGIGRGMHLGDTIIGIKGRVAFEAPGAVILIASHRELEKLVLTREQLFIKDQLTRFYGAKLHEAGWFDPVMRDLEAFLDSTQKWVCGEVRVKLYKGICSVQGVRSRYSLMNGGACYGEGSSLWSGGEAAGFSKLFSLQAALAVNRRIN